MGSHERDDRVAASIAEFIDARGPSLVGVYERLAKIVDAWKITLCEILHGGWNSLVLGALADGSTVVLKLPAEPRAVVAEAAALDWWGTELAPRVLRHDAALGALLLERLEPGTEMPWTNADDTAEVAPLLRALHRPTADATLPLPTLADLAPELFAMQAQDVNRNRRLVDVAAVERARDVLASLVATQSDGEHVVLHGDAVPANILLSGGRWRVIDPRAHVGERAYDAGYWAIFSGYGRDASRNAAVLARELGLDEQRVFGWAWGLAVNRLLQIVDSPYPPHRTLVATLTQFIHDADPEVPRR